MHKPFAMRRTLSVCMLLLLCVAKPAFGAEASTPTLDPLTIPKYVSPLLIPPAMPQSPIKDVSWDKKDGRWDKKDADKNDRGKNTRGKTDDDQGKNYDYYEIAMRQFEQQILPAGFPKTTVWGYGSANHPSTFNSPAFTIEAKYNRPVRVKWINQLVDKDGNFLPHLLPVDQTLHWANPPGPRDHHGMDPEPYTGPVPIVTHVHGAHVGEESDGYPEAWYLPAAKNIPDGYYKVGSKYAEFAAKALARYGIPWKLGSATFLYPNNQFPTTLWYHDHALGITRLNVYTGPAGFYLIRGGEYDLNGNKLPGPAPKLGDKSGTRYYEIPMAIQDRSFNDDGSLFFPDSRAFFDGFEGPYIPDSDISPIWNPEFFGNTMMVNGKTWPTLNVEPRRYRFRLLNGCNSRVLILKLVKGDPTDPDVRGGEAALPFWQIGAEGGFLPKPAKLDELLIALAERADCIVDFSQLPVGTEIYMINRGPDEPFNGMIDSEADPQTTGQVMKFKVVPRKSNDNSWLPSKLATKMPRIPRLGTPVSAREVTLNELDSAVLPDVGPRQALLGILAANGVPIPLLWDDPITELPKLGKTEEWQIYNFTMDAHPIHLHQVQFQVIDRTPMGDTLGGPTSRPPNPWETGYKDTVLALPGEVTRLKARFDILGLFVWHCHILDHEDNEMMRPLKVVK